MPSLQANGVTNHDNGSAKVLSGPGCTFLPKSYTVNEATDGSSGQGKATSSKPVVPPKKIMKMVGQAVKEWCMIEEGDRLLLGLSGGKDSLALLHILIALQVFCFNQLIGCCCL